MGLVVMWCKCGGWAEDRAEEGGTLGWVWLWTIR